MCNRMLKKWRQYHFYLNRAIDNLKKKKIDYKLVVENVNPEK